MRKIPYYVNVQAFGDNTTADLLTERDVSVCVFCTVACQDLTLGICPSIQFACQMLFRLTNC